MSRRSPSNSRDFFFQGSLSDNIDIFPPTASDDIGKADNHLPQPASKTEASRSNSPVTFQEVHWALDGRAITIVSAQTQTDWEWVEQNLSDRCQVESEIDFEPKPAEEFQTDLLGIVIGPDFENEEGKTQDENEFYGIPCVGPPRLLAYRPESKQPPVLYEKIPMVSERETELVLLCDYCQQPSKPWISREQLENNPDLELLFCCVQAQQMRERLLEWEQKLAAAELNRKIDVGPHPPFMRMQQKRAAKERAEQRFAGRGTSEGTEHRHSESISFCGPQTISYRLSNEVCTVREKPHISAVHFSLMDVRDSTNVFTLQGETDGQPRRKHVIMTFYPNGKPFSTLYPDGTGNVFYPSGNVAIIISVEAGDFTYIVMEDKEFEPNFQAIFTTRGQSTCYHPNGLIWVNLTQLGGIFFSETGALRRRWNWLDLELQATPFQPICLALGAHISLRIQTQDRIYLTFTSKNRVRINVGSKLKLTHPEGLVMPGPDIIQNHLKSKSLEIYSLLDRIQTCMAYKHTANPNIKPQYSLIAQMQRLRRQMEKQRSPKKTKALIMASKEI